MVGLLKINSIQEVGNGRKDKKSTSTNRTSPNPTNEQINLVKSTASLLYRLAFLQKVVYLLGK